MYHGVVSDESSKQSSHTDDGVNSTVASFMPSSSEEEELDMLAEYCRPLPLGVKGEKRKKPCSKSKQARNSQRAGKKQVVENAKTPQDAQPRGEAQPDDEITKKYRLTDAPGLEAILQKKLKYKKQVQTSTRGIGVAVAVTVSSIMRLKTPPPAASVPVAALYRVSLALLEEKMSRVYSESCASLRNTFSIRHFYDDPSRTEALATLERLPKSISGYIDHLGVFSLDAQDYVPVGQPDGRDAEDVIIPESGRVYLENLREVVEYLAAPRSSREVRRQFMDENPIPGAVYDCFLLTAASRDAIIPVGYDRMSLQRDVKLVNQFTAAIAKQAPAWLSPPPNLKSARGSPAILAATKRIIRVTESRVWLDEGLADANNAMYWADVNLKPFEWAVGAIGLFREPPNSDTERYPFWDGVNGNYATRHVELNLVDCLDLVYQMSW